MHSQMSMSMMAMASHKRQTQQSHAVVLAAAKTTKSAHVTIQNFAFSPASITVTKGTTVMWTNRDSTAHTVTGNTAGGPASGHIQPGQSYSFTFNSAGTFPYHCSIHPEMTGSVTVSGSSTGNQMSTNSNTTPNSSGNTGSMPMISTTPADGTTANQNASSIQLPNTGTNELVPLFIASTSAGTIVYYLSLLLRRKLP